uniref:Uncharacterized protein n=1 Tax=candidate division CPR3 bacterium TaxID=2268181 RepID=A0A7C4R448_UNCC3
MKKTLAKTLLTVIISFSVFTIMTPSITKAQDENTAPSKIECANFLSGDSLNVEQAIKCYSFKIAIFMRNVAFLVFIVMIIASGFLFITAGGKPEKIATASKALSGAVIGITIVVLSYAIIIFVENSMGNSGAIKFNSTSYHEKIKNI